MNRFSFVNVVAAALLSATQWTAFFQPTVHTRVQVADQDSMPVVVVTARRQS
jgi:hypothetical protein